MKNILKLVFLVIFLVSSFVQVSSGQGIEKMGLLECLEFALRNHSDMELAHLAIIEAEFALNKLEMDDPRVVVAKDLLAKKQAVDQAKEALEETGMNLALNVESKYYQVLKTMATINNKETSLDWAEKHFKIAEVKFASGLISKREWIAIEERVVETKKEYVDALFNLETIRMEMNLALGRELDHFFELKDQEFSYEPLQVDFTEATQYALEYGKNLLQAREDLEQAKENLELQIASEAAQIEILKAEHQLREAEIKVKRTEEKTIIEIRNAYMGFRSAEDMIKDAEDTYTKAEEQLEVLRIKYEAGMVSLIDFLEGQRELADAEIKCIQIIYDYNLAKASFNQSIGKGYSLYQEIVEEGSDNS